MANQQAAVNALGTLGAVCWSIQLIPQIVLNYRRHHTIGLQPSMMLLWAFAGIPLGIYNVLSGDKSIALQVQPQILTSLSLVTWSQCIYYGHRWSVFKSGAALIALGSLLGAIEMAFILGFRLGNDNHTPSWFLKLMAALSAAGLGLGVLRHYWDIYTHRSVRGISFLFVGLDAAGDLFSLLSVVLHKPIDGSGAAIYSVELILWIGIMICGVCYNLRRWIRSMLRRRHAASERAVSAEPSASNPPDRSPTAEAATETQARTSSTSLGTFRSRSGAHSHSVFRTTSNLDRDDNFGGPEGFEGNTELEAAPSPTPINREEWLRLRAAHHGSGRVEMG